MTAEGVSLPEWDDLIHPTGLCGHSVALKERESGEVPRLAT